MSLLKSLSLVFFTMLFLTSCSSDYEASEEGITSKKKAEETNQDISTKPSPHSYSYDQAGAAGGDFLGTSSEALPLCSDISGVGLAVGSILMLASKVEVDDGHVYNTEDHKNMLEVGSCVNATDAVGAYDGVVVYKVVEEKKTYPANEFLAKTGYWKLQDLNGAVFYAPRLHDLFEGSKLEGAYSVVDFSKLSDVPSNSSLRASQQKCSTYTSINFEAGGFLGDSAHSVSVQTPSGVYVADNNRSSVGLSTDQCVKGSFSYRYSVKTGLKLDGIKTFSGEFSLSGHEKQCTVFPDGGEISCN